MAVAIACAVLLGSGSPARSQALATLHVRSFAQQIDNAKPQVGQTFRLTISTHVDEQVAALDNVTLPNMASFDVEGDERTCSATARGSDCAEVVALVPRIPGTIVIPAATLDAVDARNKKPSRFATNTLRLQVGGSAAPSPSPEATTNTPFGGDGYLAELLWSTLRLFLIILALAVLVWYAAFRYLRARSARPAEPASAPAALAVPNAELEFATQFRLLVEALRADPTRPRALAVRHALRYALGAHEKETLADLVRRGVAADRPERIAALRAIERAAFCENDRVEHNVAEALPSLTL